MKSLFVPISAIIIAFSFTACSKEQSPDQTPPVAELIATLNKEFPDITFAPGKAGVKTNRDFKDLDEFRTYLLKRSKDTIRLVLTKFEPLPVSSSGRAAGIFPFQGSMAVPGTYTSIVAQALIQFTSELVGSTFYNKITQVDGMSSFSSVNQVTFGNTTFSYTWTQGGTSSQIQAQGASVNMSWIGNLLITEHVSVVGVPIIKSESQGVSISTSKLASSLPSLPNP